MKNPEPILVTFIWQHLALGKPEYWIAEQLARRERMDMIASQDLVGRVTRAFEARYRRRRRLKWIGVLVMVLSGVPLFLGLPVRRYPPIWPDLFGGDMRIPYLLLATTVIGAFLAFAGVGGRRGILPPRPPAQRRPGGLPPPGWPKRLFQNPRGHGCGAEGSDARKTDGNDLDAGRRGGLTP